VLAAFVMISLLPLNVNDRGIITLGSKLGAIALVTFGVHVAISLIFDLREAKPVIARMKQVMLKPVRLVQ
jgi:hypothetical protein